ncbi:MAG: DUF4168 domain-containing protein [Proteobacteria bacterium]|nr:DUF4168 domain-containing protein [Pseudomonadota bacterium]
MAEFEIRADGNGEMSDELVERVGAAAARVAVIQDGYAASVQAEEAPEARNALATQARMQAEEAIDEQGLTIDDYNAVLTAAENDPDLERRLVEAARRSL